MAKRPEPNDTPELQVLKRELREFDLPYFSDDDLRYYLEKNEGRMTETIYELLILKSEDSRLVISGLTTEDTSSYFKRLASRYKRFNSGQLA